MLAKIWNFSTWVRETDPAKLAETFDKRLHAAGFTILDMTQHHFEPMGWTGLWMLAESHFAIHTFPEENRTYIELSSCNGKKHEKFMQLVSRDELAV